MVAREMFVAGECFVRLRPRRAEDGLLVPLQLQLLQSEMLPFERMEDLGGGRRIRCGIEFDAIGRRLAYHFRRRHPGDSTDRGGPVMGGVIPETVRVPASEVLHIYRPIDAGQIRGLPHVAPVAGTYLFGASLLYKVNASTTARMNGRLFLNGSTEIKGGKGENSATHVSLATTLTLQTLVPLAAGDTVELQEYFRAADGYHLVTRPRRVPGRWGRCRSGSAP
jgi:hypothetical protein